MALVACPECKREISSEAPACPHCGKPQPEVQKAITRAAHRAQDNNQRVGCAVMIIGLIACLLFPMAGAVLMLVGLVLIFANMRFK